MVGRFMLTLLLVVPCLGGGAEFKGITETGSNPSVESFNSIKKVPGDCTTSDVKAGKSKGTVVTTTHTDSLATCYHVCYQYNLATQKCNAVNFGHGMCELLVVRKDDVLKESSIFIHAAVYSCSTASQNAPALPGPPVESFYKIKKVENPTCMVQEKAEQKLNGALVTTTHVDSLNICAHVCYQYRSLGNTCQAVNFAQGICELLAESTSTAPQLLVANALFTYATVGQCDPFKEKPLEQVKWVE